MSSDEVPTHDCAGRISTTITKINPFSVISGNEVADDGGVICVGIDVDAIVRVSAIQRAGCVCPDVVAADDVIDHVGPDLDPVPVAIPRDHVAVGRRRATDCVA